MKVSMQVLAFSLALIGIVLLRWPRRDLKGVIWILTWKEIIGFVMLGVALLLILLSRNFYQPG